MVDLDYWPVRTDLHRCQCDPPHHHLATTVGGSLRISFMELDASLGCPLPPAERFRQEWWTNQHFGCHRTHALAWNTAGWNMQDMHLVAQTLNCLA